jgi:hypothetical protein
MVEVFKTNVTNTCQARALVGMIQDRFDGYKVNFDLEDCDHILRIESTRTIEADQIVTLLRDAGVTAETLPDEVELIADLF